MLVCRKCRKRLGAFLDEELSMRERASLEHHLTQCAPCRAALTELQQLAPLLATCKVPEVPAALMTRIQAAAKARQKQKARSPLGSLWWETRIVQDWALKSATATALVVGLTIGGYMGWSSYHNASPAQFANTIYDAEVVDGPLYAFQTLGAAPQGSIVASTLSLMENGGREK